MKRPRKDSVVIFTLGILLAGLVAATVLGFQQRQNAIAQRANTLAAKSQHNSDLLRERIVIGRVRSQVTQDALHELCVRMNTKFGKLIPLEKQARKQIIHSPLYKGNEQERRNSLNLVNEALAALQPDPCNIKLNVPTEPKLHASPSPQGENAAIIRRSVQE